MAVSRQILPKQASQHRQAGIMSQVCAESAVMATALGSAALSTSTNTAEPTEELRMPGKLTSAHTCPYSCSPDMRLQSGLSLSELLCLVKAGWRVRVVHPCPSCRLHAVKVTMAAENLAEGAPTAGQIEQANEDLL